MRWLFHPVDGHLQKKRQEKTATKTNGVVWTKQRPYRREIQPNEYDDFINSSYLSVDGDQIALRSDSQRKNNEYILSPGFTVEHSALLIRYTVVDPYYKNTQNVGRFMMKESGDTFQFGSASANLAEAIMRL
ncbi:DUF6434 domain-containing protein [Pantoea sp. B65]|uniref:DUF6434 domain-containing protein n=1 Tax=Pantoea sp. B65 TaxID=2813359 RepID=UPI0039B6CE76